MLDDREIRCPSCLALDWQHDGFAMTQFDDGFITRRRMMPSTDLGRPWACSRCGYEVPDSAPLRHRLTEAATAHVE